MILFVLCGETNNLGVVMALNNETSVSDTDKRETVRKAAKVAVAVFVVSSCIVVEYAVARMILEAGFLPDSMCFGS